MKKSKSTDRTIKALFFSASIFIWEMSCRLFDVPRYIFPTPTDIVKVFGSKYGILLVHASFTALESVSGLAVASALGVIVAMAMYRVRMVRTILDPILVVSQTIPIIALAPVILIWFGVGIVPKVLIVVLVCFFPVAVNTLSGLDSSDPQMTNLLRTMGASDWEIMREAILPSSLSQVFSGLKIAATYSVMGAVIGEWLGAKSGLGIFMTRAISSFRADMLFTAIVIVVVMSLLLVRLIELVERVAMPWSFGNENDDWE
jgi:putative hydroxymethylpyrimidine transport system permease protein